jgi:hypothetical protein
MIGLLVIAELNRNYSVPAEMSEMRGKGTFANTGRPRDPEQTRSAVFFPPFVNRFR